MATEAQPALETFKSALCKKLQILKQKYRVCFLYSPAFLLLLSSLVSNWGSKLLAKFKDFAGLYKEISFPIEISQILGTLLNLLISYNQNWPTWQPIERTAQCQV